MARRRPARSGLAFAALALVLSLGGVAPAEQSYGSVAPAERTPALATSVGADGQIVARKHEDTQPEADYYVSPDGDDTWSGTLPEPNAARTDGPLFSLAKARDVLRAGIADGMTADIVVMVRGGDYYLDEAVTFGPDDSGRDGFQVIYRNYPNEQPVLHGGRPVSGWERYQGSIYRADVGPDWLFRTLYEDGVRAVQARHPNTGYLPIQAVDTVSPKQKFTFFPGDVPTVVEPTNLQFVIWSGYEATTNVSNVTSVDYASRTVTLSNERSAHYAMLPGNRYYVQAALELLDQPGEFYLDRTAGMLYYWPRSGTVDSHTVIAPTTRRILDLAGTACGHGCDPRAPVEDIVFDGLALNDTDFGEELRWVGLRDGDPYGYSTATYGVLGTSGTVTLRDARNITIRNSQIRNAGLNGIVALNWAQNITVSGNVISDVGITCVVFNGNDPVLGARSTNTYTNKGHRVVNNSISNCGRLAGGGIGVLAHQSGDNLIAHNRIDGSSRWGIGILGAVWPSNWWGRMADGRLVTPDNWQEVAYARNNVVEYNEVTRSNADGKDQGAINTAATGVDNIIRYNWIHDIGSRQGAHQIAVPGIYLDGFTDDATVDHNLIEHLPPRSGSANSNWYLPIFQNGGEKDVFRNNFVVSNGGWQAFATRKTIAWEVHDGEMVVTNNLFADSGTNAYDFFDWRDAFAQVDENLFSHPTGQAMLVKSVPAVGSEGTFAEWQAVARRSYDPRSRQTEPGFVDQAGGDYRLRYDSEAHLLGIQDIDVTEIGPTAEFPYTVGATSLARLHALTPGGRSFLTLHEGATTRLALRGRTDAGLVADLAPAKLTFTSDRPEVASVDRQGEITASRTGIARVTATATLGGVRRSTVVDILVGDAVTAMSLTAPTTDLLVSRTVALRPIGGSQLGRRLDLTDQPVTYRSENEAVATVDSTGVVTGRAPGEATIVAQLTTEDRTLTTSLPVRVYQRHLDTVSLTVPRKILRPAEITTTTVSGTMTDGTPAVFTGATVAYRTLDPAVATVDDGGKVTAIAEGRTKLVVDVALDGVTRTAMATLMVFSDDAVPADWTVRRYGTAVGYAQGDGETFKVVSNGRSTDDLQFVHQTRSAVPSRPLSVIMQVDSLGDASRGWVGPMLRANHTATAKNVMLRIDPRGLMVLTWRDIDGGVTSGQTCQHDYLPAEIALTADGPNITAYAEVEGAWKPVCWATVDLGTTVLAGIATYTLNEHPVEARLSQVQITETTP